MRAVPYASDSRRPGGPGAPACWLVVATLAAACSPPERSAQPGGAPTPARGPSAGGAPEESGPYSPRRLRRLANREIENVIADLLGEHLPPLGGGFLPDPRVEGFDNDAVALGVAESKADETFTAAARVAARLTSPGLLEQHAPCPAGSELRQCAGSFVERVAPILWGRPLADGERSRLLSVFDVGTEDGAGYAGGIALATEALLNSPHFLYRAELGPDPAPAPGSLVTLGGHEIASAMSFLLRGARPDGPLLAAGLAGELTSADVREAHARRLLETPAFRRQLARFVRSWLGIEDVAMINKDTGVYPVFTPTVRRAMDRELATFLEHVLATGGRLQDLLLADYTFPSPVLAEIYGAELLEPPGDHTRVSLHPRRRGILSSPGFLATHALLAETNPVERGLVVRSRLLCDEPPPPPPDVLAQPPPGNPMSTTRAKYEQHSADPACRGCHQLIDPVGFGFEAFDPIGRYREMEGMHPIDARGELVGTDVDGPFSGPAELAERLMRSTKFRRCLVKNLHQFAAGRPPHRGDWPEVDVLVGDLARGEDRLPELVVALVRRPAFVQRRAWTDRRPPGAGGTPMPGLGGRQ